MRKFGRPVPNVPDCRSYGQNPGTGGILITERTPKMAGEALVEEREDRAEIVQSGVWLYDNSVPTDVWIVKQNFEYWYEAGHADAAEELNDDGEAFQVVFARDERRILAQADSLRKRLSQPQRNRSTPRSIGQTTFGKSSLGGVGTRSLLSSNGSGHCVVAVKSAIRKFAVPSPRMFRIAGDTSERDESPKLAARAGR